MIPSVLLAINALGLVLSFGKALWVITPMVLGIYLAYILFGRRAVPVAVVLAGGYLASGILAIYLGLLDIDPSGRFRLWSAGIQAILDQPSLLGEGLIAPSQFIAEYHHGGQSPHNSYVSIWIRTGVIGGFAYLGIVGVSLLRGVWQYRDIDVALLALAVGYAAHHLFEAYTLFQTWSSSILAALAFGMVIFGGHPIARYGAR